MDRFDIEQAVKLAGLQLPAGAEYEIVGQDPILRSPHHLGEGAAVVAAGTMSAVVAAR